MAKVKGKHQLALQQKLMMVGQGKGRDPWTIIYIVNECIVIVILFNYSDNAASLVIIA
jgi:hypothetical protein